MDCCIGFDRFERRFCLDYFEQRFCLEGFDARFYSDQFGCRHGFAGGFRFTLDGDVLERLGWIFGAGHLSGAQNILNRPVQSLIGGIAGPRIRGGGKWIEFLILIARYVPLFGGLVL
ncbi:MAG TPA: hypothetical protein VMU48_05610 [Terracidiphilus sp.]|nr:hypothetical protein [Terracidiphilus sp.]